MTHPASRALPRSLSHAADRLAASSAARNLFGDAFVDHYAMTRHWEEREFRKAITDWELARYFEII
jgi:glutamine synthetase